MNLNNNNNRSDNFYCNVNNFSKFVCKLNKKVL